MDEREMTSGVIPLRHSSLPGHLKLPRRYEKAAMGTNGIPARVRKISIQPGQSLGDSFSERVDDLMAAIMWVKQELITLRQHDILLKRQFFNIQDSIQTLQKPKSAVFSASTNTTDSSSACQSGDAMTNGLHNGHQSPEENGWEGRRGLDKDGDFPLDTFVVRPSSSVTMLHEDSGGEEEDADIFAEEFFRPRTSSMKTSRDMAALARRRGSKELI